MQNCGCIFILAGMHKHIYKHIHVHKPVSLAHIYRGGGEKSHGLEGFHLELSK